LAKSAVAAHADARDVVIQTQIRRNVDVAAHADARDVVIQTQIRRNVDDEQTNMLQETEAWFSTGAIGCCY